MFTLNTSRALIVVLAITLFSTASLVAQNCAHPDYSTLEMLYTTTGGDSWRDNDGWLTDCEPCTWRGIECDAKKRVIGIDLNDNGLSGALPPDIGTLDQLLRINLANNDIGGELPASLFSPVALRDIDFSGNRLTGVLPATLADHPRIRSLRLADNQLTGVLPEALASLTHLEVLRLNGNNFTGGIPEVFGDLLLLTELNLSQNDLAGCFPQGILDLCGMVSVEFDDNPKLSWSGDFASLCSSGNYEDQMGAPCDDGNPDTFGDEISQDCDCSGFPDAGRHMGSGLQTQSGGENVEDLQQPLARSGAGFTLPFSTQEVERLTVFPNPVSGDNISVRLRVSTNSVQLRLLSLTGRVISSARVNGPAAELTMNDLKAGIYLVEAIAEGERHVQRIVVR